MERQELIIVDPAAWEKYRAASNKRAEASLLAAWEEREEKDWTDDAWKEHS